MKMNSRLLVGLSVAVWSVSVFAEATSPGNVGSVRLEGPFGEKLDRLIRNHVAATDAVRLADYFNERCNGGWRTEFWGKYMHSAVPFWKYSGNEELGGKIRRGFETLLSHQEPGGYLGNFDEEKRYGQNSGWDVWGTKYTLLGLLHYYDGTGDRRALDAACRLCDYLIGEVGPNGRRGYPLYQTGNYGGLPSCSVLEPVVWLYKRTKNPKYLDFAAFVVKGMTEPEDSPRLLADADVPVADRLPKKKRPPENAWSPPLDHVLTKAYELMSCYQGLLEYYEVTGRAEFLEASLKTARSIAETEINLAGGSAAGEHWFKGADQQWRHISWQQETCVTITWMRLCQKLLAITGDPFWADQLEKTFYGAYLAAVNAEMSEFAAYTPLMGSRSSGHHHCSTHTDCCNANGPRGYLAFLESVFTTTEGKATFNFFVSGKMHGEIAKGKVADFGVYTRYPRQGFAEIQYDGETGLDFTLRLRIPAFAEGAKVQLAKDAPAAAAAGRYFELSRTWKKGDRVKLSFEMPVKMHRLHENVAFTRGPLALARDSRFGDGALDEDVRADKVTEADLKSFRLVQADEPKMFMAVAGFLPVGSHTENPDNGVFPRVVHFTDYASAGVPWSPSNRYRIWLPELIPGRSY